MKSQFEPGLNSPEIALSCIAQWLERSVCNRGVASSSPIMASSLKISLLVPGVPVFSRTNVLLG